MKHASFLALVAFSHNVVADFVVTMDHPVLSGFIDPILAPGKASGHLHNIYGSSAITENSKTAVDLQENICTNANVRADQSAYWVPAAYMTNPKTKNIIRLNAMMAIYYLFNQTNYPLDELDFSPMTDGLKYFFDGTNPQFRQFIRLGCARYVDANGKLKNTPNFDPKTKLPAAQNCMHMLIRFVFPSCWNGQFEAPPDFSSQLTYALNGKCPQTHPKPIPMIHMNYDIFFPFPLSWGEDPQFLPFFFANGQFNTKDKSVAYGLHADFFGAWGKKAFRMYARQCYWYFTHNQCGNFDYGEVRPPKLRRFFDSKSAFNCRAEHQLYTQPDTLPQNTDVLKLDAQINEPIACFNTGNPESQICLARKGRNVWIRIQAFERIEPALEKQYGPVVGPLIGLSYDTYETDRGLSYNSKTSSWSETRFTKLKLSRVLQNLGTSAAITASNNLDDVSMQGFSNSTMQHWRMPPVDENNGVYKFVNAQTGKCLDVAYFDPSNGAYTHQYDCHDGINQKWSVEPCVINAKEFFQIRTQMRPYRCLAFNSKNQVVLADCNDRNDQLWDTRVVGANLE